MAVTRIHCIASAEISYGLARCVTRLPYHLPLLRPKKAQS
jgi:hypothetical protein